MNWSPLTINLGLLGAMTRDEEEFVTELRNVPEGWLGLAGLAVVVALGWAVVWMYRHEGRRGASRRVRTIMAGLRVAVLLLLVAVLLEPVRVRLLRRWVDSYTIVLVDDSSSMDLADRYADPDLAQRVQRVMGTETTGAIPRREIARRLLTDHDRRFLAKLAERNRVKLYTFSDAPELLGTIKANREAPANPRGGGEPGGGNEIAAMDDVPIRLQATGSATNLERAVRRSIDSVGTCPDRGRGGAFGRWVQPGRRGGRRGETRAATPSGRACLGDRRPGAAEKRFGLPTSSHRSMCSSRILLPSPPGSPRKDYPDNPFKCS